MKARYCLVALIGWLGLVAVMPANADESIVFSENFENGWGSWSADNGVWDVGTPSNVGPPTCHEGSKCAGTNLSGNYDTHSTRLISPSIVLPSITNGEYIGLYFMHWFEYAANDDHGGDYGQVQVKVFDPVAKTWSDWNDEGTSLQNISSVWSRKGIDLTTYAGKKIRIGFYHQNYSNYWGNNVAAGWYIDEVQVIRKILQIDTTFESGW